jgi:hypothetical protein
MQNALRNVANEAPRRVGTAVLLQQLYSIRNAADPAEPTPGHVDRHHAAGQNRSRQHMYKMVTIRDVRGLPGVLQQ